MQELSPGCVVDSRYLVEAEIGRGGMSIVYRVRHRALGSVHALKVLRDASFEARVRLKLEGQKQAKLQHPNVVRVTDVVQLGEATGLILEHVDGPTLEAAQRDGLLGGWDERDALARGILLGVKAAHAEGWVHRDLKPSNVLLARADGVWIPKVADFGIARAVGEPSVTKTGAAVGSPAYMAPEQQGGGDVDARADIFSLGALLYELATGARAFDGTVFEVTSAIARGRYRPPRELAPDLPARMERAILGALAVNPAERVRTCEDLLAIWCGDALAGAPPRSTRWRWAAAAVVAILAAAAGGMAFVPIGPEQTPVVKKPPDPVPGQGDEDAVEADQPPVIRTEQVVVPTTTTSPPPPIPKLPPPKPPPEPTGTVLAEGANVELVRPDGSWLRPGRVPVGTYAARVQLADGPRACGPVEVSEGATVTVAWVANFQRCKVGP